jgi:phosphoribosylanthranilate isomerase
MTGALELFVKICGMTSAEAVDVATSSGADAIGFVFAPSVRQVTPARARELAAPARGRVACVAVTRHPSQAVIDEVLRDFLPDILQTDIEDLDTLRLPETLAVLPVMRTGAPITGVLPRRVLFEGPVSGSGTTTDWHAAADLARRAQLILAGGLAPDNVGAAVRRVQPFGVDVSSGVEERPGVKNAARIREFVAAARTAALEMQA